MQNLREIDTEKINETTGNTRTEKYSIWSKSKTLMDLTAEQR